MHDCMLPSQPSPGASRQGYPEPASWNDDGLELLSERSKIIVFCLLDGKDEQRAPNANTNANAHADADADADTDTNTNNHTRTHTNTKTGTNTDTSTDTECHTPDTEYRLQVPCRYQAGGGGRPVWGRISICNDVNINDNNNNNNNNEE